jgi:hypothetical protein
MHPEGGQSESPPLWRAFLARLAELDNPHDVRAAQIEYLQTLFPTCRVEYTPPELKPLATPRARWLRSTEAYRWEGLPIRGESALLDDMVSIAGPLRQLSQAHLQWLSLARQAVMRRLHALQGSPLDEHEHPVTRLGREPLFHQCVESLAGQRQLAFHGMLISIEGFARWAEGRRDQSEALLCQLAGLLRDIHPPRAVLFHLSHAFFAALCTGPTRREYRKLAWDLRNRVLRRGFLPDRSMGISIGVAFWPTDACFATPFCELLLRSLARAHRQAGNAVTFSEDWHRNPFFRD